MPRITVSDGAEIFYKDWGSGPCVILSHGWPLSADAWDAQMVFLGERGYRVVTHDRRGHGRSSQSWDGNHMDQYADDLAALIEALDLKEAVLVGHSTGGGEVAHYVGRHGTGRLAKVVLLGAVPPLMLRTEANPVGLPIEVFDGIRKGTFDDRSQFFRDLALPFYGYNRPGATLSEGVRDSLWLQGMMGGIKGQLDCIREFSDRRADADRARRRRPDRAHRRLCPAVLQARPGCRAEGLPRRAARPGAHARGRVQRRPARLHPELTRALHPLDP